METSTEELGTEEVLKKMEEEIREDMKNRDYREIERKAILRYQKFKGYENPGAALLFGRIIRYMCAEKNTGVQIGMEGILESLKNEYKYWSDILENEKRQSTSIKWHGDINMEEKIKEFYEIEEYLQVIQSAISLSQGLIKMEKEEVIGYLLNLREAI